MKKAKGRNLGFDYAKREDLRKRFSVSPIPQSELFLWRVRSLCRRELLQIARVVRFQ